MRLKCVDENFHLDLYEKILSFTWSIYTNHGILKLSDTSDLIPPTTEEWGLDEWNPVEQVTPRHIVTKSAYTRSDSKFTDYRY